MQIAEAYVEIVARLDKFERDLDQMAKRSGKAAGQTLTNNLAQVFAAGAFLKGMQNSIDAASNLNEQVNRTSLIFPTAGAEMEKLGQKAAESFGLSQRAFLEATAGLGGLLQNLGFTEAAAADSSVKLTQMAADLGSAFNKEPAQAIEAIGSALRGESEPIRAFNVILDEARIKAKAFEMGLYSGKGAIDSNAKAQATLALITEQTAKVQGDFANTIDSAANAERVAAAKREDASASMGKSFLPIYERAVKVVGQLAEVFGSLPAPIQTGVVALVGFVALSGPISKTVDLVKQIRTSFQASALSAGGFAKSLGVVGAVLSVATAAYAAYTDAKKNDAEAMAHAMRLAGEFARALSIEEMAKDFENWSLMIVMAGKHVSNNFDDMARASLEGAIALRDSGIVAEESAEWQEALALAIENEIAAREQQKISADNAAAAEAAAGAEAERTGASQETLWKAIVNKMEADHDATGASDEHASAMGKASNSAENLAAWQEKSAESAERFAIDVGKLDEELHNLVDALDEVIGRNMNLEDANQALYEGTVAITDAVKANGTTLDIATEAGRKNRDVVQQQVKNILAHGEAMIEQGSSQAEATAAIELGRQALLEQMTQLGLTEAEAKAYIDQLGLTPENIVTSVALANTENTKREIDAIVERLGPIDDPREAKIQALIDEGKYEEALRQLKLLERTLKPSIVPVNAYSISSGTVFRSAVGRYVPAGSNMLTTVAEPGAGAEAILPLENRSRLDQLLSDPRVGGPIAAAMGGSTAGGNVTTVHAPITIFGVEDRYVSQLMDRMRVLARSRK